MSAVRWRRSAAAFAVLAAVGCQSTPSGPAEHTTAQPPTTSTKTPSMVPATTARAGNAPTGWGPTKAEWLAAQRAVSTMSDADLAGQVMVAEYAGPTPPTALIAQYHLGGVIVLGDNITTVSALESSNSQLQSSVHRGWPLVIATDQEGGIVQRAGLPLTQFPTFMSYGAADDPVLTQQAAQASGEELRAVGFTMVFAPDSDVTIGPADPTIGSRSAGGDPSAVADQVVAADKGYDNSGIVSVIKHFPGHGSLTTDSHESLPVQNRSLDELTRRDFVPFAAAAHNGASAVMVGHISVTALDPGVPADLSKKVVSLLSSQLGFHGLITTDALNMGAISDTRSSANAAVAALNAGVDLVLMPADVGAAYDGILTALRNGSLARSRVQDAAAKIVALMMHEAHQPAPGRSTIGSHGAVSEQVSARALTLVSGACTGPYVGQAVTPEGSSTAVASFTRAANSAGLAVRPGGTSVSLLGYGYGPSVADVVVSLDTPYVLASSRASVAKLALYGEDAGAMKALVAVLLGKATATGSLPVSFEGLHQQGGC